MTRTQLYLDDAIHARLTMLARRQGRSLSDLVREALARAYGADREDERQNSLKAIEGLWKDRSDLPRTDAYVRRLRRDTRSKRLRPS
jgi:plasmid stability protein